MMGITQSSENRKSDDTPKVSIESSMILEDVMFQLHALGSIAESISSATDCQYELIQSVFDGKGGLGQQSDEPVVLSHANLNEGEKKTLAYLQDDICMQALIIKKTVAHLADLFEKSFGSAVDGKGQAQSKYVSKKIRSGENVNQIRLDKHYLRSECERLRYKLIQTEEKLRKLYPQTSREEISGKNQTQDYDLRSSEILTKKLDELEDNLKKKNEELQKIANEFDSELAKRTKALNDDIDTYKRKVNRLERDLKDMKKDNTYLDQEKRSLKRNFEEMEREKSKEIKRLEGELCKLKGQIERKRAQKTVYLYTHRRGELLSKVIVELKQMLELQFDAQGMTLRILDCENASEIETNKPILVLCINASRLGTDVSNALTGIQGNENVSVVVLHHKETHALPNQSSERVLTSMEYKSLGGIIDMAFLSNRGIYPCDMNNHAMSIILDFIIQRNK